MRVRMAVIQVNSRNNLAENMVAVEQSLDRAAEMGAQFVGLPNYGRIWDHMLGMRKWRRRYRVPRSNCSRRKHGNTT